MAAPLRSLLPGLLLAAGALFGGAQAVAAEFPGQSALPSRFEEGVHYTRLPIPVETRDPLKIEVVEVFSYGCIHCYRLQSAVQTWRPTLDDDVDFYRLPLVTSHLRPLGQAYYAAETLGVLDRVHMPIFAAIHEYRINMASPEQLRSLFAREAGVDNADFERAYESFGVASQVRQAEATGRMYRVMSTPSIVVNGRYLAHAGQTGSMQGLLLVVNHLIDIERERTAAQTEGATEAGE